MKQARQKNWVIHQLNTYGEVSRNKALENYISRLGSIINALKKPPYNYVFTAYYKKTKSYYREVVGGQDYIYKVVKRELPSPFKPLDTKQGELL